MDARSYALHVRGRIDAERFDDLRAVAQCADDRSIRLRFDSNQGRRHENPFLQRPNRLAETIHDLERVCGRLAMREKPPQVRPRGGGVGTIAGDVQAQNESWHQLSALAPRLALL